MDRPDYDVVFYREPLSDCVKDVDLIPPFNRMLLEVTFGKLYSWSIQNIRNILLEAIVRFKELGTTLYHLTLLIQSQTRRSDWWLFV